MAPFRKSSAVWGQIVFVERLVLVVKMGAGCLLMAVMSKTYCLRLPWRTASMNQGADANLTNVGQWVEIETSVREGCRSMVTCSFKVRLLLASMLLPAPLLANPISGGTPPSHSQGADGAQVASKIDKAVETLDPVKYVGCQVEKDQVPKRYKGGYCLHDEVDGPSICVDATAKGRGATKRFNFRGDVFTAGETLTVFVKTDLTNRVHFALCRSNDTVNSVTGTAADTGLGTVVAGVTKRGAKKKTVGVARYDVKIFKPGQFKTFVEVVKNDGAQVIAPTEKTVRTVGKYSQALHFGLGATMLHAGNVSYRTETRQGSQQRELVAEDRENIAMDLMIGYTPYIFGRPADGCRGFGCFSPYVGLALMQLEQSPRFFRGVYGGIDYELHDTLSIAFVAGLRRTDVPREDYEVGAPIGNDADPSIDGWRLSYGIMLNLSPSVLKSAIKAKKEIGL